MNKIKVILVDDELAGIENLANMLEDYCPEVEVIGKAHTVSDAIQLIENQTPDALFLDIQLRGEKGFDILRQLSQISFEVVFVTAFDSYGIQAVKFSALDYLLKPLDYKELIYAVGKLKDKVHSKRENELIRNLKHQLTLPEDRSNHKIALPSNKDTILVKCAEILYCKSDNSYTTFYLLNGSKRLVCKSIKEYEMLLSEYGFIRTHQSYLVNKEFVKGYSKSNGIILTNDMNIPVSIQRWDEVLQRLV